MRLKALQCNRCGALKTFPNYMLYEQCIKLAAKNGWRICSEQEHYCYLCDEEMSR